MATPPRTALTCQPHKSKVPEVTWRSGSGLSSLPRTVLAGPGRLTLPAPMAKADSLALGWLPVQPYERDLTPLLGLIKDMPMAPRKTASEMQNASNFQETGH